MNDTEQTIEMYKDFWLTDPSTKEDLEVQYNHCSKSISEIFSNDSPIAEYLRSSEQLSVIDVCCGRGVMARAALNLITEASQRQISNFITYTGLDGWDAGDELKQLINDVKIEFIKHDIQKPLSLKFDIVMCIAALHHVDNHIDALRNMCSMVAKEGYIILSFNDTLPVLRNITDASLRNYVQSLPESEKRKFCDDITILAESFRSLPKFKTPELKALGIPAGEYHPQEFLNYFIIKAYYNPLLTLSRNNHFNYDWYLPSVCKGLETNEVINEIKKLGFGIEHIYKPTISSVTICAKKKGNK